MNKISDFLWKIFCSFMVLSYQVSVRADVTSLADTISDLKKTTDSLTNIKTTYSKVKICSKNQYIKKCGDYTIGTNWLKGFSYTETTGSGDDAQTTNITTPNYFDYSENAKFVNAENLKIFIEAKPKTSFSYQTASGTVETVGVEVFKEHRDAILSHFCDPTTTQFTCEDCSNGGYTSSYATITVQKRGQTVIGPSDWDLRIANHCSLNEFKDLTGTFVYVTDEEQSSYADIGCFYTPESFFGTALTNMLTTSV